MSAAAAYTPAGVNEKDASHEAKNSSNKAEHSRASNYMHMPRHLHLPRGIDKDGESGRKGFHPVHFFRIIGRSSCVPSAMVNILWPFVPAAIVLYALSVHHKEEYAKAAFACNYLAMIPCANLLGFAGQELARKLPKVLGVVLETFLGGLVEIVLFSVLIKLSEEGGHRDYVPVIQAAILGSILANLLFCMGLCFVAGGIRHVTQKFDGAITEVGCGLLLMAAFGLAIPRAFAFSLQQEGIDAARQVDIITHVSRIDAVILLISFVIYVGFQMASHHGLYSAIFEADEERDHDRHDDLNKAKLTLTECLIAITIALGLVSMHAVFLVESIDAVLEVNGEGGVTEMFLGLILVPLVEKFAEHLTAIDEAWDNTMNLALAHVLGATLQTALLNTSIVVLIGWGLDKPMNLDFVTFHVIVVVLAILAVGSFLRDQESNYLEGSLCVLIYVLIAATAWYYPNPQEHADFGGEPLAVEGAHGGEAGGAEAGGAEGSTASPTEAGGEMAHTVSSLMASMTGEAMGEAIEKLARMLAKM